MERRGDRPHLDIEDLRDAPVVEVRVVAQEQDEPLPLRERSHDRRELHALVSGPGAVRGKSGLVQLSLAGMTTSLLARGIHDGAPHPRLERRLASEVATRADDRGERVLHGLASSFPLAHDRCRDGDEIGETRAVERLDLGEERRIT